MAQQIQGIWVKETKAGSGYASTLKPQACGLCSQKLKKIRTPQIPKQEHVPLSSSLAVFMSKKVEVIIPSPKRPRFLKLKR